jgi:hypothetical protein
MLWIIKYEYRKLQVCLNLKMLHIVYRAGSYDPEKLV